MALEDQRLDYLRRQLDAHGLFCKRKIDGDPSSYRFLVVQDPEMELILSKVLPETSEYHPGLLFLTKEDLEGIIRALST
jgi:hypothetical protein